MTPRATILPTDELTAYHRDERLGRARSPFTTPVFFSDTPPAPPAPPTPPAPTPPAPPAPPAPTPGPAPAPAPPNPNDPLAVLQAELNRVGAAEKAQGQRQATTEMLTALGFASVDEAKAFVEAKRKADLDAMSEADRKTAEAAAAQAAADQEKAAVATERRNLLVTERLVLATDLPAERREAVRAQIAAATAAIDPTQRDVAAAAVDAAIDAVRKDAAMAVLFTPVAPHDPNRPPAPPTHVPGPAPRPHVPAPGDDVASIVAGITQRTGIK